MASGGPKPPNLTRYKTEAYQSIVHRADEDFSKGSLYVLEYEFPQKKGPLREFWGYYRNRGPYA